MNNSNITQEEKSAYNSFLNELRKALLVSGEVTSSVLGDILSMQYSRYLALGSYFKKLGYAGIVASLKEGYDSNSPNPVYKYVLGTAIVSLSMSSTPLLLLIPGAYMIGYLAESLWDSFFDLGEWLAENQNNETEAIRNLLANKNIIITDEHVTCPIDLFIDQYNLLYEFDDLIKELSDDFSAASSTRSPLAIDLDGDGIETVSVENGVYFDHDGNGFAEKSGWASADDGILVRDINNNSEIDDSSELFGNSTILSNGQKAANGFQALADLDSNNDGVLIAA